MSSKLLLLILIITNPIFGYRIIEDGVPVACKDIVDSLLPLMAEAYESDSVKTIGSGGFSHIKSFYHSQLKTEVALKMTRVKPLIHKFVTKEYRTMKELENYPFVAKLVPGESCYYRGDMFAIVMEKYDTSLESYNNQPSNKNFNTYLTWKLMTILAISNALTRLHKLNYLHRDFKGSNILMKGDFIFVLGDLAFSKKINSFKTLFKMNSIKSDHKLGSPLYMAPEINSHKLYSPESDIYALGVTIFMLFTNVKLEITKLVDIDKILDDYCSGGNAYTSKSFSNNSTSFVDFMNKMETSTIDGIDSYVYDELNGAQTNFSSSLYVDKDYGGIDFDQFKGEVKPVSHVQRFAEQDGDLGPDIIHRPTNKNTGTLEKTELELPSENSELEEIKENVYCKHINPLVLKMVNKKADQRPTGENLIEQLKAAIQASLSHINQEKERLNKEISELESKGAEDKNIDLQMDLTFKQKVLHKLESAPIMGEFMYQVSTYPIDRQYSHTLIKDNEVFFTEMYNNEPSAIGLSFDNYMKLLNEKYGTQPSPSNKANDFIKKGEEAKHYGII